MISREAQAAIDGMLAQRANKRVGGTPYDEVCEIFEQRREGEERARRLPVPDGLTLGYDCADGVRGEWLRCLPQDPEHLPEKVILFLHGGGFANGSAISRRALCAKISLYAKIDSFSIDYRQCPEYRYPAHVDDCVTAFVWLLKKGYAPQNICLFGESAGGNLVLAMTHYLRDHHLPVPGAVCSFSPVVDLAHGYDSWITHAGRDAMIGEDIPEDQLEQRLREFREGSDSLKTLYCTLEQAYSPYISPIRGDFTGFPRLMIQVGTEERLYDDAIAVYQKARAAGVDVVLQEWEGLGHVFALFDCPETEAVCEQIGLFFRK